ncbi:MAG: GGDEF domain-containing protein [Thermoleophilia bacterium]
MDHPGAAASAPVRLADDVLGLDETHLVGASRRRVESPLHGREQVTTILVGAGFALVAILLAATAGPAPGPGVLALLVACHALTARVEFELGPGVFLPTQIVLVPMLFVAPPGLVPLLVALGYALGSIPGVVRGRMPADRALVRLSYSWHAVGPALVFLALDPGPPAWSDAPVYLLALAAQFAFDLVSSLVRETIGVGVAPRELLPALARTYVVDALLAPIGLLAALAAVQHRYAFAGVLSLTALLAFLSWDRKRQIARTIALSSAYEHAAATARVDLLTGLANRLAWEERLAEVAAARTPAAIALLDVDGLKEANDTRGHAFGDAVIRETARLVARTAPPGALVARLGGDELGVLVLHPSPTLCAEAHALLADAVAAHPGLDGFRLAASIGCASTPPEPTIGAAVAEADERMYERKRASRRARTGSPDRA